MADDAVTADDVRLLLTALAGVAECCGCNPVRALTDEQAVRLAALAAAHRIPVDGIR